MFDIGFWELVVIAIIGLVILGPERLPSAISTLSRWTASIRQTANSLKAELNHELHIKEMHDNLKKAEQQGIDKILDPDLRASVEELKNAAQSVQRPFAGNNNGEFTVPLTPTDTANPKPVTPEEGKSSDGNLP